MTHGGENGKIRVLIVDDEQIVRDTLLYLLSKKGFEVELAATGIEAAEKAALNAPDIIILDFVMSDLNGVETHRRLRENPVTRKIPIIYFSALNELPGEVVGVPGPTIVFFRKPFEIEPLFEHIERYGQRKAGELPG